MLLHLKRPAVVSATDGKHLTNYPPPPITPQVRRLVLFQMRLVEVIHSTLSSASLPRVSATEHQLSPWDPTYRLVSSLRPTLMPNNRKIFYILFYNKMELLLLQLLKTDIRHDHCTYNFTMKFAVLCDTTD